MRWVKFLALVLAGVVVFASGTYVFAAGDTEPVSATVTAEFITVSVDDGSVAYGLLATSASTSTLPGAGNDSQTVSVIGSNVPVEIAISSSNAIDPGEGTDWNLENAIGMLDEYEHEYSTDASTFSNFPADNNMTATIVTLSDAETEVLDFQITAPSSTTDGNQKTITILVQATAS